MLNIPSGISGSLVVAALVTGCASQGQPTAPSGSAAPAEPAPGSLCNAQPAQSVVGQSSTASVVEWARARSGAQMARILRPGQIITKEFNAQRLNLEVDANGRIQAVRCG